ncbi:hypothetical protein HGRIS_012576 [Hohenbuehelia grisea]|uniref:Uncharacterized protein n=1 Tax=Hohenbuehelia grisea TaxID=104357 RepID=A0ABR3IST5_9AGAR
MEDKLAGLVHDLAHEYGKRRYGRPDAPMNWAADFEQPTKDADLAQNPPAPPDVVSPVWTLQRSYSDKSDAPQWSLGWDSVLSLDKKDQSKFLEFRRSVAAKIEIVKLVRHVQEGGQDHPVQDAPQVQPAQAHICCLVNPTRKLAEVAAADYGLNPVFFMPASSTSPVSHHVIPGNKQFTLDVNFSFPRDTTHCWLLARTDPIINGAGSDEDIIPQGADSHELDGKIQLDSVNVHVSKTAEAVKLVALSESSDLPDSLASCCKGIYWQSRWVSVCEDDEQSGNTDRYWMLLFLVFWYVIRRWDEAIEASSRFLGLLEVRPNINFMRRLHYIQAHLLQSKGPLSDVERSLRHLMDLFSTKGKLAVIPCLDSRVYGELELLLAEAKRLERRRELCSDRVNNCLTLLYNDATIQDSGDMRQLTYVTTAFLPATFLAGVFGINSLAFHEHTILKTYIVSSIPLTLGTVWILVMAQIRHWFPNIHLQPWYMRILWPLLVLQHWWAKAPASWQHPWSVAFRWVTPQANAAAARGRISNKEMV